MASCGYTSITMIVLVSVLVGVPCGPSSFNLANVECVAIGECSKNVYNHLVYCKIGNESTLHWTLNLTYYLLEQVGGFLLDIANPSGRIGHFKKNYNNKSTFLFQAFLRQKGSHLRVTVCPRHRYLFRTSWRCSNSRRSIPAEVAMVAARKGTSSLPKAQCGLKKADSTHVVSATNILAQLGLRMYLYKWFSLIINYPQFVYAVTLGLFHVRGGEGGGEVNQRDTYAGLLYFRQSWHRKPLLKHTLLIENRYCRDLKKQKQEQKSRVPPFPNLTWFIRSCPTNSSCI